MMRKQEGLSLVEILISLFLASLLMAVVMQQYLASKRQYMHVQTLLEQAFELHLVTDLIRDSLRRGGFTPCMGINSLTTLDGRNGETQLRAIKVKEGEEDDLYINRMSEHFMTVALQISPSKFLLRSKESLERVQTVLVADCYHAEVQQVSRIQKTTAGVLLQLSKPLAFNYTAPIYVGEWIEEAFYIQKNRQGHAALFYQLKHAEELSSSINKMSIDLKSNQGKTLVQVKLGLEQAKPLLIETEVRAG